jgi:hypothetical protein
MYLQSVILTEYGLVSHSILNVSIVIRIPSKNMVCPPRIEQLSILGDHHTIVLLQSRRHLQFQERRLQVGCSI